VSATREVNPRGSYHLQPHVCGLPRRECSLRDHFRHGGQRSTTSIPLPLRRPFPCSLGDAMMTAMATGQRCRSLDAGLRPTLACVVDVKYSKTFIIIKGRQDRDITNYLCILILFLEDTVQGALGFLVYSSRGSLSLSCAPTR